ncbi:MAG TPA: hypothetical protein DCX95_06500 [Elusimicrobia bacterium]|nr:hypothetical protein [Elusimicrobiota bacterium]
MKRKEGLRTVDNNEFLNQLMKKIILFVFIFQLTINVYAKEYIYTLLEMTRKSEIVVLAKCIKIKDEKYEIGTSMGKLSKLAGNRFAIYKIIEIFKGKYDKDKLTLDYKTINEKYQPFVCRGAVNPVIDEQVLLFLEKDLVLFIGSQGKVNVKKEEVSLYKEAIKNFIELDNLSGKEKVLFTIKNIDIDNLFIRESMLREIHEIDNTEYGFQIANLLKHKEVIVRRNAISALENTKDKRVISLVIDALKNSDPDVRRDATTVLWRLDDERITPVLMKSYSDEDPNVRRSIIFALSRRNCKEAIPLYLKAMSDGDPLVRSYGINSFEWVSDPSVIPEILNALKDENSDVRQSAIRVLYVYIRCGKIKPDDKTVDSVSLLLNDKDSMVRNQASFFFVELGGCGYKNFFNDKIINKLIKISKTDENPNTRSSALSALETIEKRIK